MFLHPPVTAAAEGHWVPPSPSTAACWRRCCTSKGAKAHYYYSCGLEIFKFILSGGAPDVNRKSDLLSLFSRMLQIQHQPQPQVQAPHAGPTQNPLLFLAQHQSSSPSSTTVFASPPMFDTPSALPPQQTSVGLQHGPWQQTLKTSSSGCSSSSSSCFSSSLSPVASAAYLLEARLHISQQTLPHPHNGFQQQPGSATQCTFPTTAKPAMWRMASVSSTDPNMQELGLAAQQQLSSCVMVK